MLLRLPLCLGLLLACCANAGGAPATTARLYAPTPGDTTSATYSLTVNGVAVQVVKFGDVHYARFMLTGAVEVQVTSLDQTIKRALISPLSHKIEGRRKGKTLTFAVAKPCDLFLKINELDALILFIDAPETETPGPRDSGVVNLADYLGRDRDATIPVTAEVQKAIDETSLSRNGEGGVLYVPGGHYLAGQLKLRSNVHLYLESGALLQSQVDFNERDFPRQANGDSSFIFIGDATNVMISGRGIIDGNGYAVRTANARANIKLLRSAGATNLVVRDVFFRDSARWSLHLLDSDRVVLSRFKLLNDLRGGFDPKEKVHHAVVTNTDGVDIDASRDVIVEGAFIYTCDDAITPKVTNYMGRQGPCRGLIIRNNVFWTLKCALKVGDETIEEMHDMLFEKNYILHADRVIALWSGDGGRIHNIRVINNAVESVGGDYNERFFFFRIRVRREGISRPGIIDNVLIKDFYAVRPAPQPSSFEGYDADHTISGVTFENIVIGGRQAKSARDIPLSLRAFADQPAFTDAPGVSN